MTQNGEVPVSAARHGRRFWRRFASYDFARHQRALPVVIDEILPVASAFPIVFRDTDAGPEPVALLRLGAAEVTPFVSAEGRWVGRYVPSILRAHPFRATPSGEGGQMMMLVDEDSGLVTDDPRDEPFFTPDGALSTPLQQVLDFLRDRAASERRTRTACAALRDAGVLRDLTPRAGMTEDQAQGLLAVDADRLAAVPDADLPALMQGGALRLAHAQMISLEHCTWLARATPGGTRPSDRPAPGATSGTADDSLSGFLSALADAQASDAGGMR